MCGYLAYSDVFRGIIYHGQVNLTIKGRGLIKWNDNALKRSPSGPYPTLQFQHCLWPP